MFSDLSNLSSSIVLLFFCKYSLQADLLHGTEEAFRRNLTLSAVPLVYLRNQFIQRSGDIASNMCYIHHGVVEVYGLNIDFSI